MKEDTREAIDRLLDEDLPSADQAVLLTQIENDQACVAHLAERALLHTGLRQVLRRHAIQRTALAGAGAMEAGVDHRFAAPRRARFRRAMVALAAAACVVVAGWWTWLRIPSVPVEIIAADEGTGFAAGQRVALRELKLPDGHLQLRLGSGVLLDVSGPAEIRLENSMRLRLLQGRLSADVGEHGKGFVIETEQAQIVDLGTKFGVDVAEPGHTDVVVFQGEVELFDRKAKRQSEAALTRLVEGEAVRVDARQQMSRIVNVTSAADGGEWSTRGDSDGSVIASVRDNLRDPAARNYYRILSGGLREDARAFVGQRHEWNGIDAAGIPAELLGADLVQTFMNDRMKTALEIIVTVARPAVVYVLSDSRIATPSWLAESFTDTGARIGLENAPTLDSGRSIMKGPGAGNMAPFAVWKRELPQGGSITLGPPRQSPDQRLLWMYGIAAKPL